MINSIFSIRMIFVILSCVASVSFGAQVIPANALQEDQSFAVPLGAFVAHSAGSSFYVSARPAGVGDAADFAIARLVRAGSSFDPLTPKKVMLNQKENVDNPLFNARIQLLSLVENFNSKEVVLSVLASNPLVIYALFDMKSPGIVLLSSPEVTDAQGQVTSGLIGLANTSDGVVFAAVKPHQEGSVFGDPASGIALLGLELVDRGGLTSDFNLFNAQSRERETTEQKAAALDCTSPVIKIGDNVPLIIQDSVPMHWDGLCNRLFIGLRLTTGNASGARSIVTGRREGTQVIFEKIVPDEGVDAAQNQIIATQSENAALTVQSIKTMRTSTALSYLIVHGGNGDIQSTNNTVFALPLISSASPSLVGTIARKNSAIKDLFIGNFFTGRTFTDPVRTAEDMTRSSDPAALVGGGAIPVGSLTSMTVMGDAVFVTIEAVEDQREAGIFSSRALFDADGRIRGWTVWQRSGGSSQNVFGVSVDKTTAHSLFLTGNDQQLVTTVKRTQWSDGSQQGLEPLTQILNVLLPINLGGIQGIREFSIDTPGLKDIVLLSAFGRESMALIQTGTRGQIAPIATRSEEFSNMLPFNNARITQTIDPADNVRIVTLSGGILNTIAPLTSVEIVRSENGLNSWLCIAGAHGLVVLADENGRGWNPINNELGIGFVGLREGMNLVSIGDYSQVRALLSDEQFLYILTDTRLDRVVLTPQSIMTGNIDATTIATLSDVGLGTFGDSFFDVIVSEKFALLATSGGLFRVANNKNVRMITSSSDAWTRVSVPEEIGPVLHLISFSPSGRIQGSARRSFGSNVYSISGTRSTGRAQLNRFVVESVEGNEISDTTVQPFNDRFSNQISYFANFARPTEFFLSDGALNFFSHNTGSFGARGVTLFASHMTGVNATAIRGVSVPINFSNGELINALLQNSASGSFLVGGDFGIQVNE